MTSLLHIVLLCIAAGEYYLAMQLLEHMLVVGSSGSGKTSSLAQLMFAIMQAGFGMVIYCVKPDECERVLNIAKKAGRCDVKILGDGSSETFDAGGYEYEATGKNIEAFLDYLNAMMNANKPITGNDGSSRFFEGGAEGLLRNLIVILKAAGLTPSFHLCAELISCLPSLARPVDSEAFGKTRLAQILKSIDYQKLSKPEQDDLNTATEDLLERYPFLPTETTGSIEMTAHVFLKKFSISPLREKLSSGVSTMTPDGVVKRSEIHIINFPSTTNGIDTSRLCALSYKVASDRAILRRDIRKYPSIIVKWIDEFQLLMTPPSGGTSRENENLQIARSARYGTVCLTQSISNIAEALGEHSIGAKTKALLGNFATKIFFQNNDVDTNQYAADLIGKEWRYIKSRGLSMRDMNTGGQQQLVHKLEPDFFSTLKKASVDDPVAECVIHIGGRTFDCTPENPDGCNYLLTEFTRS